MRAVFGGETVVDNHSVKLLHETGHLPVYYFPEEDLRGDLLEPTDHTTHCPFKGDASYRSVRVEDRIAEYAVWTYPEPLEDAPPILGYVALYHDAMDKWLEEDEEVFGHPHDPYHRVDVLESSRHVRVSLNGEVVAETERPKILFETGLPPRYYIPPEDVRTDLLVPSETKTVCPYIRRSVVPLSADERRGRRGHRLVLSGAPARSPEGQGSPLLLRREGRLRGRRLTAEAA